MCWSSSEDEYYDGKAKASRSYESDSDLMSTPDRKIRKTLRPTDDDLMQLDLKPGEN